MLSGGPALPRVSGMHAAHGHSVPENGSHQPEDVVQREAENGGEREV
jgi:hypothetical protein